MKKMQKIMSVAIMSIALITLSGNLKAQTEGLQTSPSSESSKETAKPDDWKEMTAFHEIMAKTFHPAEDGNLQPIKTQIAVFVERAKAWDFSAPPKEYNKPDIKKLTNALYEGALKLQTSIKEGADDKAITADLSTLHDTFHKIVGECRKDMSENSEMKKKNTEIDQKKRLEENNAADSKKAEQKAAEDAAKNPKN